ncbi:hypothetical protein BDZ91DRAFT_718493 [Kalaharituber pfeilii]|nr:hypothetical protein BDZ91DRAFT_718493 [Kalaharituber pfeilii]
MDISMASASAPPATNPGFPLLSSIAGPGPDIPASTVTTAITAVPPLPKPCRKSRGNFNHHPHQQTSSGQWTSSKCLRMLRPFISKISSLKTFIQSTPSAVLGSSMTNSHTGNNYCSTVESFGSAASSAGVGSGQATRRTSGEFTTEYVGGRRVDEEYMPPLSRHDSWSRGTRRRGARQATRTYGTNGSGTTTRATRTTNSNSGGEPTGRCIGNIGTSTGNNNRDGGSLSHLMAQKSTLNQALYTHYTAIYQCLAQIISSTGVKKQSSSPISSMDLRSDTAPLKGVPSLVALATHALAHCILSTAPSENSHSSSHQSQGSHSKQQEIPQSEWYDALEDVSSRYLPALLRFHAVEIAVQSIRSEEIDCNLGALLTGMCYEMGAEHEGEALIKAVLEVDEKRGVHCIYTYLISSENSRRDTAYVGKGWRLLKEHLINRLPEAGIGALAPILGGPTGRTLRDKAWKDWMNYSITEARDFMIESLKLAFGIGGACARDDIRIRMCRLDKMKKAVAATSQSDSQDSRVSIVAVKKLKRIVYGNNIINKIPAKKIEDAILEMLDPIAKHALGLLPCSESQTQEAMGILLELASGFHAQSGEVRNVVESLWGGADPLTHRQKEKGLYPKDVKALILLLSAQGIQGKKEKDNVTLEAVARELGRVLDEKKYAILAAAKEAAANTSAAESRSTMVVQMPNDDTFIEGLVDLLIDLYTSDDISKELGQESVQKLVKVLMDLAFPPRTSTSTTTSPAFPHTPARKPVAVWKPSPATPGSGDEEETSTRYYLSRLALALATRFTSLPETKYCEAWVEWVENIEQKVIGMPIPTPARKPAHFRYRRSLRGVEISKQKSPKQRYGWKWEEGLGAWVAKTGITPAKHGTVLRRSSRGVSEREEERKWSFEGIVLDGLPRARGSEYEFFEDSEEGELEELEEEEDGPLGVTEFEDEDGQDKEEEVMVGASDGEQPPLSPIVVKKRSTAYIQPSSASSLSSEEESECDVENNKPIALRKSTRASTARNLAPPTPPRTRHRSAASTAYQAIQQRLRRRKSMRAAALAPKRYDVDLDSDSVQDYDPRSGDEAVEQDTPATTTSMLSSPPPEKNLRSRSDGILGGTASGGREKQISLLDIIGGVPASSPVTRSATKKWSGGAGGVIEKALFELEVPAKKSRKRAIAKKEDEDSEDSLAEADDEKDEDYAYSLRRRARRNSACERKILSNSPTISHIHKAKKRKIDTEGAGVDEGHEDVFLDGNKWELRSAQRIRRRDVYEPVKHKRRLRSVSGMGSGVYSSPPQSTRSDEEDEDKNEDAHKLNGGWSSESEDKEGSGSDEEFLLVTPKSQTQTQTRARRVQPGQQLSRTRSQGSSADVDISATMSMNTTTTSKSTITTSRPTCSPYSATTITLSSLSSLPSRPSRSSSSSLSSFVSSRASPRRTQVQASLKSSWATTKEHRTAKSAEIKTNATSTTNPKITLSRRSSNRSARVDVVKNVLGPLGSRVATRSKVGGCVGGGGGARRSSARLSAGRGVCYAELPDEDELSEDELA